MGDDIRKEVYSQLKTVAHGFVDPDPRVTPQQTKFLVDASFIFHDKDRLPESTNEGDKHRYLTGYLKDMSGSVDLLKDKELFPRSKFPNADILLSERRLAAYKRYLDLATGFSEKTFTDNSQLKHYAPSGIAQLANTQLAAECRADKNKPFCP